QRFVSILLVGYPFIERSFRGMYPLSRSRRRRTESHIVERELHSLGSTLSLTRVLVDSPLELGPSGAAKRVKEGHVVGIPVVAGNPVRQFGQGQGGNRHGICGIRWFP